MVIIYIKINYLDEERRLKLVSEYRKSFNRKLISIFLFILITATSLIGISSYQITKKALAEKGKVVLKNSVVQALALIRSEYNKVQAGSISQAEAQETIKTFLAGPMKADGTRDLHGNIDLSEHGYFIIYDKKGFEVLHPTLEGQNVLDVTDLNDAEHYIVKEQIETALSGGGYTYYAWRLPHSNKIGKKISYVAYSPDWEWIVAATAYELDFVNEATEILYTIGLVTTILIFFTGYIGTKYIKSATKPVLDIASGMKNVTEGRYQSIPAGNYNDETKVLIDGYNTMIESLEKAERKITIKNDRLTYLAYNDELTLLPNRNGMKEYVDQRLSNGCNFGYLAQLDIMGLKLINLTLGYEQGDKVLGLLGKYLRQYKKDNNYPARTGSNEFSIWIEAVEQQRIYPLLKEIREKSQQYVIENGYNQMLDIYLALTMYDGQNKSFETLYEETTTAMRTAREKRDLSITLFEESMKERVENELAMRRHLDKAISEKEIIPYYQAQVDFTTEKVVGVEALARWISSELGFVPPNVFIPYINQLNLITEFTEYMIDKVLSNYQDLVMKYDSDLTISINISPLCFMEKDFTGKVERAINKHHIPPHKLILEITEDVFIADYKEINRIITKLRELFVKVSIDDFGTGYSSLNYLMNIQPDEIKIDKSFVGQILDDEKAFYMFDTLCNIAENFGYSIVAEGVENKKQLEKISTTSLKIIQGYLFSKPEPLITEMPAGKNSGSCS
ncbi:EAL domain-containing protein [uncultured Desulfobacter sp.]|uniref:EAL domain-containing protein n=1 Tax=uncultured Desulfobacter sp. TaxID=240139 RepID=UPI002AA74F51|nr:EAL domain-containing protein [uncultured Desulfobacter sp.]